VLLGIASDGPIVIALVFGFGAIIASIAQAIFGIWGELERISILAMVGQRKRGLNCCVGGEGIIREMIGSIVLVSLLLAGGVLLFSHPLSV